MKKDSLLLWYGDEAKYIMEALPIGSGHLGAMLFGRTDDETIALNHDEVWSGIPGLYAGYPGGSFAMGERKEIFTRARSLALEGRLDEAQELLERDFEGSDSQAYLPLGNLRIKYGGGEISDYKRSLSLSEAVCAVEYTVGGKKHKREAFASCPDNVIAYKISSQREERLTISFDSPLRGECSTDSDTLYFDGVCPSYSDRRNADKTKFYVYLEGDENHGISVRAGVRVVSDGSVMSDGKSLAVTGKNITLYIAAETSFAGFDKHPYLEGKEYKKPVAERLQSAVKSGYKELRERHIEDYRSLFDRMSLELGSDSKEGIPTDERLRRFAEGESDRALYTLVFNFGRYLMISASRPGTQAMNLQGIWNDAPVPPWNANYTTNINTEMNYWPALSCNLAELQEPLFKLIKGLSVTGRECAKGFYGAEGFAAHHNADIWMHCVPVQGMAQWSFWPMASGWLCRHLYENYEYTLDEEFLKRAYPIMKEAARFYISVMTEYKGELMLAPSTSPENSFYFAGKPCAVSQTSAMTMTIIRELFTNCKKAAEKLGDSDFKAELEPLIEKLYKLRIGSRGQLLEWYEEREETEPNHRHTSHLYGLYPADLINEDTPEYFEACKRTLEERGDSGTGWSLGWKINFWARLNDGNHALRLLKNQLKFKSADATGYDYSRGGGTYPNLFDAHPPFQIDGNFAYPAGVAEMLIRSRDDKIYLLPALPDEWSDGSVSGIRAKRGITADISWKNGEITAYTLFGDPDIIANTEVVFPK